MRSSIIFLASLLVAGSAPAADRFVTPRGSDAGNDCTSSAAPCATVAHAVVQASSGDVVKLSIGTHRTNVLVDAPAALTLSGGWSLGFTRQDDAGRPPRTRLSGSRLDRVLALDADAETIDVTLERVAVMHGQSSTSIGGAGPHGGGILALARNGGSATLTMRDVVVKQNRTPSPFGTSGGGLGTFGESGGTVTVTVEDSSFVSNVSSGRGGAIAMAGEGLQSIALERVLLQRNSAGSGGSGGAISLDRTGVGPGTTLTVEDAVFERNVAQRGGAVYLDGPTTATMVNSVVRHPLGGSFGTVTLESTLGGTPELTMTNCTLVARGPRPPAGLHVAHGTARIANTIVWGFQGDVALYFGATLDASHSDFGPVASPSPAGPGTLNDLGGNISVDPQLVRPTGQPPHLSATSPCVDAGTCVGAPAVDFEGDPRPSGAQCDIGADEVG
jgi:predicted outer membrane repeat protein